MFQNCLFLTSVQLCYRSNSVGTSALVPICPTLGLKCPRPRVKVSQPYDRNVLVLKQRKILPISRRPNFTKFEHNKLIVYENVPNRILKNKS